MTNQKGNKYPAWIISNEYQVFAVDAYAKTHVMSDKNFALDIGVSEDGTVWIVSTNPDPDGGGGKILWSNGDNKWNEVNSKDPGAIIISGAGPKSCVYINAKSELHAIDTGHNHTLLFENVYNVDYRRGNLWGLTPEKEGGIPILQYAPASQITKWTPIKGNLNPSSISAITDKKCALIINNQPVSVTMDGKSPKPYAPDQKISAMQISVNDYDNFILSDTDITEEGNQVMVFYSNQNGEGYENVKGLRASKIISTYYTP